MVGWGVGAESAEFRNVLKVGREDRSGTVRYCVEHSERRRYAQILEMCSTLAEKTGSAEFCPQR